MRALVPALLLVLLAGPAFGQARIKDVASVQGVEGGVQGGVLVGRGLVAGLAGTGDGPGFGPTGDARDAILRGTGAPPSPVRGPARSAATVAVTARIPADAVPGQRIDVEVSAIGDARSLAGGTLLPTELADPDGRVRAVASGPVQVSGISAQGAAARVLSGAPNAGRIPAGAMVETAGPGGGGSPPARPRLVLRSPDLTTAARIAQAVSGAFGIGSARATGPSVVELSPPPGLDPVQFLAAVEQLPVTPDAAGAVVTDPASGATLADRAARVAPFAVTHGALRVRIVEEPAVSQPAPFSSGRTVVVPRTRIEIEEGRAGRVLVQDGGTVADLLRALDAAGASPGEVADILRAARAAGALHGDLR
jgi:flagellar P-ring protein precursor FlgI